MNRIVAALAVISLLSVGLMAQEEAPKPEIVKFTAKIPAKGDQVVKGTTTTAELLVTSSAMGAESKMKQGVKNKETKTVTILEATDKKVTKFKIHYKDLKMERFQESEEMGEADITDLLEGYNPTGNTYIFTLTDQGTTVTDEAGEAIGSDQLEFLKEKEVTNGKFTGWDPIGSDLFTKREFTVGETVNIPRDKALILIPNRDLLGDDISIKVTATLKGIKTVFGVKCGVFDVVTTIEGAPKMPGVGLPGMEMALEMKLSGSLTMGIDNMWIYGLKHSGPVDLEVSMESDEFSVNAIGKGDAKMEFLNVYAKVKIEAPAKQPAQK